MSSVIGAASQQPSTSLRFFSPGGPVNVRQALNDVLAAGTTSLRAAVCFFTDAGCLLLAKHAKRLAQSQSFFVASIDSPTSLKALDRLHQMVPGHVYIHLGGVTPEERGVGRSLMHSKVFLAEAVDGWKLWVGSHNLTAMAIEGGNFEAASLLTAPTSTQSIQDAIIHLETCRNTAELFDPADMERYRDIQRRQCETDWESERNVLVIHAEASVWPEEDSFIARIQIVPTELDRTVRNDRAIRLFLHPRGSLVAGTMVDYDQAKMWIGEITAVVRTDLHPRVPGARGEFQSANYDIDIPSLNSIPVLVAGGRSTVRPCTQAVIRVDRRGQIGDEIYSIGGRSPFVNTLDDAGDQDLHEIENDMMRFFTANSLKGKRLVYRPVAGVRQDVVVKGYDETIRSRTQRRPSVNESNSDVVNSAKAMKEDRRRIEYFVEPPKRPIDPYLFLSNYVIRSR